MVPALSGIVPNLPGTVLVLSVMVPRIMVMFQTMQYLSGIMPRFLVILRTMEKFVWNAARDLGHIPDKVGTIQDITGTIPEKVGTIPKKSASFQTLLALFQTMTAWYANKSSKSFHAKVYSFGRSGV